DVVAGVADDGVEQPIAAAVDVGAAGQGQALDIGAQRVAYGADHLVGAGVGRFHRLVAGIVDEIDVVAGAAVHGVRAQSAVQRVRAGAAGGDVVALAADARGVAAGGAEQRDRVGSDEIGQARAHTVVDQNRLGVHHAVGSEYHVAGDLQGVEAAAAVDISRRR